jgi:hypothetical protein
MVLTFRRVFMRLTLDFGRIYLRGIASRRRRSLLAVLAAPIAVLATIIGTAGIASASPSRVTVPDTPVVTIHLTYASSYCVGVKNDNNHAGAAVWLYKCAQAKSDQWYESEYECPGGEGQPQCFVLVDRKNDQLCLGLNDVRAAVLQNCGYGGDLPSNFAVWNSTAQNGLRSTGWGVEGNLWTATDRNTAALSGQDRDAGGGGWWQWSGY